MLDGMSLRCAISALSLCVVLGCQENRQHPLIEVAGTNPDAADESSSNDTPDYDAFDQTPGAGWRVDAEAGKFLEAARAIDDHVEQNANLEEWQRINLSFHAGQCYAMGAETETAIERFRSAIRRDEPADFPMRWNAYVRATIAFLEADRVILLQSRAKIAEGPDPDANRPNLIVVDRLIANFGKPYKVAYGDETPNNG